MPRGSIQANGKLILKKMGYKVEGLIDRNYGHTVKYNGKDAFGFYETSDNNSIRVGRFVLRDPYISRFIDPETIVVYGLRYLPEAGGRIYAYYRDGVIQVSVEIPEPRFGPKSVLKVAKFLDAVRYRKEMDDELSRAIERPIAKKFRKRLKN